ncbi:12012_t:CDS:2 [Funneliformis geosporum]|nr:12012_t:CDS:2 [Funneliformis geosporum]
MSTLKKQKMTLLSNNQKTTTDIHNVIENIILSNDIPSNMISPPTNVSSTVAPPLEMDFTKKKPPNTTDTFKFIQEKLDNIENKLTLIDDEIVSLKNSIIKHEQNQKDINFRLNHFEYMHYVEHDPKQIDDLDYEFPLHNGEEEMEITPITPFI